MKVPPTKEDGSFDLDAEWECEHCQRKVPLRDTALSWCLNIICDECNERERASENDKLTRDAGAKTL